MVAIPGSLGYEHASSFTPFPDEAQNRSSTGSMHGQGRASTAFAGSRASRSVKINGSSIVHTMEARDSSGNVGESGSGSMLRKSGMLSEFRESMRSLKELKEREEAQPVSLATGMWRERPRIPVIVRLSIEQYISTATTTSGNSKPTIQRAGTSNNLGAGTDSGARIKAVGRIERVFYKPLPGFNLVGSELPVGQRDDGPDHGGLIKEKDGQIVKLTIFDKPIGYLRWTANKKEEEHAPQRTYGRRRGDWHKAGSHDSNDSKKEDTDVGPMPIGKPRLVQHMYTDPDPVPDFDEHAYTQLVRMPQSQVDKFVQEVVIPGVHKLSETSVMWEKFKSIPIDLTLDYTTCCYPKGAPVAVQYQRKQSSPSMMLDSMGNEIDENGNPKSGDDLSHNLSSPRNQKGLGRASVLKDHSSSAATPWREGCIQGLLDNGMYVVHLTSTVVPFEDDLMNFEVSDNGTRTDRIEIVPAVVVEMDLQIQDHEPLPVFRYNPGQKLMITIPRAPGIWFEATVLDFGDRGHCGQHSMEVEAKYAWHANQGSGLVDKSKKSIGIASATGSEPLDGSKKWGSVGLRSASSRRSTASRFSMKSTGGDDSTRLSAFDFPAPPTNQSFALNSIIAVDSKKSQRGHDEPKSIGHAVANRMKLLRKAGSIVEPRASSDNENEDERESFPSPSQGRSSHISSRISFSAAVSEVKSAPEIKIVNGGGNNVSFDKKESGGKGNGNGSGSNEDITSNFCGDKVPEQKDSFQNGKSKPVSSPAQERKAKIMLKKSSTRDIVPVATVQLALAELKGCSSSSSSRSSSISGDDAEVKAVNAKPAVSVGRRRASQWNIDGVSSVSSKDKGVFGRRKSPVFLGRRTTAHGAGSLPASLFSKQGEDGVVRKSSINPLSSDMQTAKEQIKSLHESMKMSDKFRKPSIIKSSINNSAPDQKRLEEIIRASQESMNNRDSKSSHSSPMQNSGTIGSPSSPIASASSKGVRISGKTSTSRVSVDMTGLHAARISGELGLNTDDNGMRRRRTAFNMTQDSTDWSDQLHGLAPSMSKFQNYSASFRKTTANKTGRLRLMLNEYNHCVATLTNDAYENERRSYQKDLKCRFGVMRDPFCGSSGSIFALEMPLVVKEVPEIPGCPLQEPPEIDSDDEDAADPHAYIWNMLRQVEENFNFNFSIKIYFFAPKFDVFSTKILILY